MKLRSFTIPALAALFNYSAISCQERIRPTEETAIQVPKTRSAYLDSVVYATPMRMFTEAGEITDPAQIDAYRQAHGICGESAPLASARPGNVLSSSVERVTYGGSAAGDDVVIMRQQDTGTVGTGSRQGSVDILFAAERAFLKLREEILEMQEGVTRLDRVDDQNYSLRECYHVRGESNGETLRVPYTFVATRSQLGNYPCKLKRGIIPSVSSGDTVLVRERFIALR